MSVFKYSENLHFQSAAVWNHRDLIHAAQPHATRLDRCIASGRGRSEFGHNVDSIPL